MNCQVQLSVSGQSEVLQRSLAQISVQPLTMAGCKGLDETVIELFKKMWVGKDADTQTLEKALVGIQVVFNYSYISALPSLKWIPCEYHMQLFATLHLSWEWDGATPSYLCSVDHLPLAKLINPAFQIFCSSTSKCTFFLDLFQRGFRRAAIATRLLLFAV